MEPVWILSRAGSVCVCRVCVCGSSTRTSARSTPKLYGEHVGFDDVDAEDDTIIVIEMNELL